MSNLHVFRQLSKESKGITQKIEVKDLLKKNWLKLFNFNPPPPTHDEDIARLYELLEGLNTNRRHKPEVEQKIKEAQGIVERMTYEEQEDFFNNYTFLADKLVEGLSWLQMEAPGSGFITGLDIEFVRPILATDKYDNPILQMLDEESARKAPDAERMELLLEITDQVQITVQEEALKSHVKMFGTLFLDTDEVNMVKEIEKKELFIAEVAYILKKNNYVRPPKPESTFVRPRRNFYIKLLLDNFKRNAKNPDNTDLLDLANVFLNPLQLGNQQAQIKGFSLYDYQNNKESGGHVYGMRFAEGAEADITLDMDEGLLTAKGNKLPFEAFHYLSGNVSVHSNAGSFDGVNLEMHWPTNRNREKGTKRHKRHDLVSSTIDLSDATFEMNDLQYVSRGAPVNGKVDQYTVGLGKIKAEGLWIKGITRTNEAKNFRTGKRVLYELTYGIQDASLIITYGIMAVVDQMMSAKAQYPSTSLKDYRDMIINVMGGKHTVQLGFRSLVINDIVYSDYHGFIEDMNFGDSTISLKDTASAALEKVQKELENLQGQVAMLQLQRTLLVMQHDDAGIALIDERIMLLQDQIALKQMDVNKQKEKDNQDKINADVKRKELKDLQALLPPLYEQRAELLSRGESVKDKDIEINNLKTAIAKKQFEVNELVKDQQIDFVFETAQPANINNAFLIEGQVKTALANELSTYGLMDSKGWDDVQFLKGFTLNSTLQSEKITGTILTIPDAFIPFAGDTELGYDFGSFKMNGKNLRIPGIHVKATIKWTDANAAMQKPGETNVPVVPDIQVDFEELEVTAGSMLLDSLTITDENAPQRNISLTGFTKLSTVKLVFNDISNRTDDYMGGVTFSCEKIETADIAALYLPKKGDIQAPQGMDFWFREQIDNKLVLNGFSVTHEEPEILRDAVKNGALGEIKDTTRFEFKNAQIGTILAAQILGSANVTYFENTIENTSTFSRDDKNEIIKHDTSSKIGLKFGLSAVSVPEAGLRTPGFEMSLAPPGMSEKRLRADIVKMENQLRNPNLLPEDRKKGQFYLDTWRKYLVAAQQKSSALFTGIHVDMEINAFYPEKGETQWQNIKVNQFKSTLLQATNLNLTFHDIPKQGEKEKADPDSAFHLYGQNTIYGLNVQGVTYDFQQKELIFDPGGVISADGTQISLFVSDYLRLTGASTGFLSFEKLTDVEGYAYTLTDIKGRYALGEDMIIGNQETPLSVSGKFDWNDATGLMKLSLHTSGTIYIPEVVTPSLTLHSVDGVLSVIGIDGDIEIQFSKKKKKGVETDEWFCDSVLFKSLTINQISSMGLDLKMGTTVLKGTPGEENTISGVRLTNVRFDPQHPGFEDITGTIFAKSVDLKHFDVMQAGDIFTLLKGGITGEDITFSQMKRGQFNFSITNPKLFADEIKAGGMTIDGVNGALNPIFSAGKIEIANTLTEKQGEPMRKGWYVTVTDPFFNEITIESDENIEAADGEIEINNITLCGQGTGKVTVWIDDPAKNTNPLIEIDSLSTDFTIEKLDLETPDYSAFQFPDNSEEEAAKRAKEKARRLQEAGISPDEYNRLMFSPDFTAGHGLFKTERISTDVVTNADILHPEYEEEVPLNTDEALRMKIFGIEDQMRKEEHAELMKQYNFLDLMVGGSVSVSLFGTEIPLNLLRVPAGKPTNVMIEETGGWPANLEAERQSGVLYTTFADVPRLLADIRAVIGLRFETFKQQMGSLLLQSDVEDDQLRVVYNYIFDQVYLATLLEDVTRENLKVVTSTETLFTIPGEIMTLVKSLANPQLNTFNQLQKEPDIAVNTYHSVFYAKLSALVGSVIHSQNVDTVLYEVMHPTGPEEEDPWWFRWFIKPELDSIMIQISKMLHNDMNPSVKVTGATFDMAGKTADQKGMLSFVQPKDGDAPLQTSLELHLNQENRYHVESWMGYDIFTRKALGPQLTLTNFNMPHMMEGSPTDKTKFFFEGNGVSFSKLKFGIDEMNYVPDHEKEKQAQMDNPSKHATLYGENILIKGFKLRIPREKPQKSKGQTTVKKKVPQAVGKISGGAK